MVSPLVGEYCIKVHKNQVVAGVGRTNHIEDMDVVVKEGRETRRARRRREMMVERMTSQILHSAQDASKSPASPVPESRARVPRRQ